MKVKTLLAAMMHDFDEAEIYTDNMTLITRVKPGTLKNVYGDWKVKKFWIYVDEENDGQTTLEIILH